MLYSFRFSRWVLGLSLGAWIGFASAPAWAQSTATKAAQTAPEPATPSWVWYGEAGDNAKMMMRREIEVQGEIQTATLAFCADNQSEVFINGRKAASSDDWGQLTTADIGSRLTAGKNTVGVTAKNDNGPAGVLFFLRIQYKDGKVVDVVSDENWKATNDAKGPWRDAGFDDASWQSPKVLGKLGQAGLAWSDKMKSEELVIALGSGNASEFKPEIAANAKVPEGFKIEKIFHVPRPMGSWVSLTTDPKGRLIASDQGGAGLFLITPGTGDKPTQVEKLPVKLSGAQGLLWAFDSLYAVVNGGNQSGLHRLRDTDGDGLVDQDEYCMHVPGGGEHGPHAVVLSPDGKSLFVCSGNHTKLPSDIAGSKIPTNWNEDHLLPRRWDANGHAAGILAPGGWICNVDPSGKQWTVYSMGYRNEYDIAFNPEGELFSYDADMEWDFGSPWYRPTRVCHATSGSEFGWRSGTGKWPAYYEDSLPGAVDIGPGSPTGIVFGTGAKFPAKYQKALFILDWTYSTIYSIDLTPSGSTYVGTKNDFVTGSPLPVTDGVIGNDGALYFAVGGRGTQSALYRVSYVGNESTAPVSGVDTQGAEARAMRRKLESYHGRKDGDVDFILQHLGHEDRFLRYAARVALESQPVDQWRNKALAVQGAKASINASMALAHQGVAADLAGILRKLNQVDVGSLVESDKLAWLRALQLAFIRLGEPTEEDRVKWVAKLDGMYPTSSYPINAELVQLLVYLKSPTVIAKTLALMDQLGPEPKPDWGYLVERNAGYGGTVGKMLADMPPVRGIHFAFVLRNVKSGWTLDQRRKYFEFFLEAAKHPGGNSYGKFLMQFRDDAIATCSDAEKIVLEPIMGKSLIAAPIQAQPPKGPGRKWSTVEAVEVAGQSSKRNFKQGQNLFHATSCSKCHRLAGEGGAIGPDLSTAAKKFSLQDMIDAIIEPSKAISDQYGSHQVVTDDGRVLVGRTVEIGEEVYVYTVEADAKPVILKKEDITSITPSKISQMPVGLVDPLNDEELKDLIAYLMAAGDPKSDIYK